MEQLDNNIKNNEIDSEKIEIHINNTNNVLTWLKHMLELIKEYGPFKIIGAAFLIAVVSIFLYFIFNPIKAVEIYDEWKNKQHDERMELRMQMGPKIQSLTDKLTYGVGATRTMVLELHNGNTGTGGLPFAKCTATYESLNIGKHPVSEQYQEVNLSLMPFAHKLFDEGYWCGQTDELIGIDRALYYKMKANGVEHFAACVIEGVDSKPIAFMIVSYDKLAQDIEFHDCNETRNNIRHVAMELAVVLEVNRLLQ